MLLIMKIAAHVIFNYACKCVTITCYSCSRVTGCASFFYLSSVYHVQQYYTHTIQHRLENVYLANVLLDCALRSMWFCTTTNDDVKCNITWRKRRRRVWARARAIWFCWWCTRTSGNARATLHASINKIAHMIFRVCHLISLVLYRLACVISVARYPHCSFPLYYFFYLIYVY